VALRLRCGPGQPDKRHSGYSNIVLVKKNCQGVSFTALPGKACKSRNKFGDLTGILKGFCNFRNSINISIIFTANILLPDFQEENFKPVL